MLYRLRLIILVLCMLPITLSVATSGESTPNPLPEVAQIQVIEIVNRVETRRTPTEGPKALSFFLAHIGQDLLPGDAVKTFQNSEARVDIAIREFTRITRTTPNTIWRLGQFAVAGSTIIEFDQGKIFLFDDGFREGQPDVQVVTPAGTASPRGTWMSVGYDPQTGVTEVLCFRGRCELKNVYGVLVLVDEQKSAMTIHTAPRQPEPLDSEEIASFLDLPEARSGEVAIPPVESATATPGPALEATRPATSLGQPDPGKPTSGTQVADRVNPAGAPQDKVAGDGLGVVDAVGEVLEDTGADVGEIADDDTVNGATEAIGNTADDAGEVVEDTVDDVVQVVDDTVEVVDDTVDDVVEVVDDTVADAAEALDDTVDEVAETTDQTVDEVVETTEDTVDEVVETTEDTVDEVVETTEDTVDEVVETTEDTVDEVVETTEDTVDEVVETTEDTVDEVVETTEDTVNEVVETVDEPVDDGDGSGGLVDDLVDVVGGLLGGL